MLILYILELTFFFIVQEIIKFSYIITAAKVDIVNLATSQGDIKIEI